MELVSIRGEICHRSVVLGGWVPALASQQWWHPWHSCCSPSASLQHPGTASCLSPGWVHFFEYSFLMTKSAREKQPKAHVRSRKSIQSHYSRRMVPIKVNGLTNIWHSNDRKLWTWKSLKRKLEVWSRNFRGLGLIHFTKIEAAKKNQYILKMTPWCPSSPLSINRSKSSNTSASHLGWKSFPIKFSHHENTISLKFWTSKYAPVEIHTRALSVFWLSISVINKDKA